MRAVALFLLSYQSIACPYLGGKTQSAPVRLSVLEMYLGSRGGITGASLPSLPSAHQKYSTSDLPSLVAAVLDHSFQEAAQQLQAKPSLAVDQSDDGGFNALQWAAMTGTNEFVELFFRHGVQPNPESKYPPLHLAVMQNHSETVVMLMKQGAQVTLRSAQGLTPFLHAVDEGHVAIASLLLVAGADVNDRVRDSPLQIPALGVAAMRGEVGLVELMLRHGADRSVSTTQRHSPLIFAAGANHLDVVNLLLTQPSANSSSSPAGCPASFANESRIHQVEGSRGRTALHWAITGDPSGKRVSVHRSAGRPKVPGVPVPVVPPPTREEEREYDARQARLLETLLVHGADPNKPDRQGHSPLFLAASEECSHDRDTRSHGFTRDNHWPQGRPDLVEVLLRGGALPRTRQDEIGRFAGSAEESEKAKLLRWAVERDYAQILRLLLFPPPFVTLPAAARSEEDPRVVDISRLSVHDGSSLLSHALLNSKWEVASLLVLAGHPVTDNSTVLSDVLRKQVLRGQELTPEQVAVYLQLHHIPSDFCSQLMQQGLGTRELREVSSEVVFSQRLDGDVHASQAWPVLQSLLAPPGLWGYLQSLFD